MSLLNENLNFKHLTLFTSVFSCLLFALIYVLSLYLWSNKNRYNRSEPSVIKRRFISVLITCVISFIYIYLIALQSDQNSFSIWEWIGFKFDLNLIKSSIASILLTVILFSGPLVQYITSSYFLNLRFKDYEQNETNKLNLTNFKKRLRQDFTDLTFWRNYIVSPFTEEFVFRSCMLPLLVNHFGFGYSCILAPSFFAIAHLHHIFEGYIMGEELKTLLIIHLFQFSYTYIFGLYSCYLFLRTGQIWPSFISHSFCNFMGVPNISQLLVAFNLKFRLVISFIYVFGLVMFFYLMATMTEPSLYNNLTYKFIN